jgi:hypothetical protein
MMKDGLLIYGEPIAGSKSYACLVVVPMQLQNIVFITFHSNPIGGHLNAACTFHCIRLCFYWANMYTYIPRMCHFCPGWTLSNPTHGKSYKLTYNFSIEAPMMVLHIKSYQARKESGFEGSSQYLIACCGMCTFSVTEPVSNANATTYASGTMKIILCFGICHTIFLDKESKFFGVCCGALDLLQINCHVLSKSNHNPMLVEQLNRYLNQGLQIMGNKRDSNSIALEAILLLLYAWNPCPILGTNISLCMIAVRQEFAFPIDFSVGKHAELYSAPGTVTSYSKDLAIHLESCCKISMLLVWEQCCWHCKLVNSRHRDPCIHHDGDIVFSQRATCSDAKRGCIDNLMHPFTGPWRIVKLLPGTLYKIECVHKPSRQDKKHAADLLRYPPELIPFEPIIMPTIVTASSISQTVNHRTKRLASKVSHTPNHFALHATSSPRVISVTYNS